MTYIPNTDFLLEVAQGNVTGHSIVFINGRNDDVDTVITDLNMRDNIFPWLTSAQTMELLSDSVADSATGNGARLVTIKGLDGNFNEIEEDVIMGEATPVATVNTYMRINKLIVKEVGVLSTTNEGANVGTIVCRVSGGGATHASIDGSAIDSGISQDFRYTIPANHEGIILSAGLSVESNKLATAIFHIRPDADIVTAPFSSKRTGITVKGLSGLHTVVNELLNLRVLEKTDIWASALASANNTEVSAAISLLLIKQS